ncbi:MAG: hypothetical protein ACT4N1_01770 [Nitrososphaerota archaeon]
MRRFWENKREKEEIEGDLESGEGTFNIEEGDLISEEAIIKDKERFGRVRNSLMKYLRAKYGDRVADRALWRVNRRMTEGYLNGKTLNNFYRHSTKLIE